jgi:hypothetical protein
MFTLISYQMNVQGKAYQMHNVHMTFEAKIALAKLMDDSRVKAVQVQGQYATLAEAQAVQKILRGEK